MFSSKIIPKHLNNCKIRVSWFDKTNSMYYYGDWRNYNNKKFLARWVDNQNKIYEDQFYRIEYKRLK